MTTRMDHGFTEFDLEDDRWWQLSPAERDDIMREGAEFADQIMAEYRGETREALAKDAADCRAYDEGRDEGLF